MFSVLLEAAVNSDTPGQPDANSAALFFSAWISFALIAVSSSQVARVFPLLRLPLITGYLFFGVLCGPYLLNLLTKSDLTQLTAITQIALSFISLSAGAELYLPELRALFKRIMAITIWLTIITFIVTTIVIFILALGGQIPYISDIPSSGCKFSIAMIAGTIMVTQSPASTIAIVRELGAKGPFTSTMLGVTVLCDVIVLFLFSVTASITTSSCISTVTSEEAVAPLGMGYALLVTVGCIFMAVVLGYLFGKFIIFLIWIPSIIGELLVLPLGFLIFRFTLWFTHYSAENYGVGVNFDPLLICIVAGYVVANHSHNRRKFLKFLGKAGPIVFIPFFTLTGAGLNLKVMGMAAGFAFVVFATRALCFLLSTWLAGYNTHLPPDHRKTLWLSMLTQAGVSLGIASEVAIQFPEWGPNFQSVIIAVVLLNQLFGPVGCKWALKRAGDAGKGGEEEEEHHGLRKRIVFIGMDSFTLSLAQRMLFADWNIIMMDWNVQRLDGSKYLVVPKHEDEHHDEETTTTTTPAVPVTSSTKPEILSPATNQSLVEPFQTSSEVEPSTSQQPLESSDDDSKQNDISVEMESSRTNKSISPEGIDESATFASYATEHGITDQEYERQKKMEDEAHERQVRIQTRTIALDDMQQHHHEEDEGYYHVAVSNPNSARVTSAPHTPRTQLDDHDLSNPYLQERITEGIDRISQDLNTSNTQSIVVMLDNDMLTYHVCQLIVEKLQLVHVQALIHNPAWVHLFINMGVAPIYPFSITTHMIFNSIMVGPSPPKGTAVGAMVIGKKQTLAQALAALIAPELSNLHLSPTLHSTFLQAITSQSPSMDSLSAARNASAQASLAFAHLSDSERYAWFQRYPDPPSYIPNFQTKLNNTLLSIPERVQVETYAMRDDYLSSIDSAHNNLNIPINLKANSAASHVTFASPMLYHDDEEDELSNVPVRQNTVR